MDEEDEELITAEQKLDCILCLTKSITIPDDRTFNIILEIQSIYLEDDYS